ncbi:oligoendopeptidase F [Sesbania bispinosa]|nr:oligoendopeptidase F [Sesbania bispinosa]
MAEALANVKTSTKERDKLAADMVILKHKLTTETTKKLKAVANARKAASDLELDQMESGSEYKRAVWFHVLPRMRSHSSVMVEDSGGTSGHLLVVPLASWNKRVDEVHLGSKFVVILSRGAEFGIKITVRFKDQSLK